MIYEDARMKASMDRLYALAVYSEFKPNWLVRRMVVVASKAGISIELYLPWYFRAVGWFVALRWQAKAITKARTLKTNYGIVRVRTWNRKHQKND